MAIPHGLSVFPFLAVFDCRMNIVLECLVANAWMDVYSEFKLPGAGSMRQGLLASCKSCVRTLGRYPVRSEIAEAASRRGLAQT